MASTLTESEKDQLINMFESLESKPKMDDPETLQQWMTDYLSSKGSIRMTDQEQKPEVIYKPPCYRNPE